MICEPPSTRNSGEPNGPGTFSIGYLPQGYSLESLPGLRGTKACTVVPRLSWDLIESVPFRILSRSSMLIKPSPRPAFASVDVKTGSEVANREMNLIRRSPRTHFEVPYSAIFC